MTRHKIGSVQVYIEGASGDLHPKDKYDVHVSYRETHDLDYWVIDFGYPYEYNLETLFRSYGEFQESLDKTFRIDIGRKLQIKMPDFIHWMERASIVAAALDSGN